MRIAMMALNPHAVPEPSPTLSTLWKLGPLRVENGPRIVDAMKPAGGREGNSVPINRDRSGPVRPAFATERAKPIQPKVGWCRKFDWPRFE